MARKRDPAADTYKRAEQQVDRIGHNESSSAQSRRTSEKLFGNARLWSERLPTFLSKNTVPVFASTTQLSKPNAPIARDLPTRPYCLMWLGSGYSRRELAQIFGDLLKLAGIQAYHLELEIRVNTKR
jgi:hypothetical protein